MDDISPALDRLIEEHKKLKRAYELLYKVFYEHGPYKHEPISDLTWRELRSFFKFDDSE